MAIPAPGTMVDDHYLLRERIAEGGMGVVFRAEQVALARVVAVKFLHPDLAAVPALLERFRQEAHAASLLSHPHAAAVIDYGVADGAPFLVMEYVRGSSLARLVRRAGPLPLARALDLVAQILGALEYAHDVGVVHADITSDNVLVETLADGSDLVKVIDFGLARTRDDDSAAGAPPSGTPEYLAPEVIGGEPPTAASDLYAVGAILYELLTGATPFAADSTPAVLESQLFDAVVPPSLRRPERAIPPAIDRACLRALAKRPADRFASAAEFAASLDLADAGAARCEACGGPRPEDARYCPECGTTAIPEEVARDAPTNPIEMAPGESGDHLRAAIGEAIARGDVDEIAVRYLALAHALCVRHREIEAIAELEEGVNLVTAGDGAAARYATSSLWRLLIALARLVERFGDAPRAQRLTLDALRHAHR